MATIGQVLATPETGWLRLDDTDGKFQYIGTWSQTGATGYYNSYAKYTTDANGQVKFKFYGTKLRLISAYLDTQSNNNQISIDGVTEQFSCYSATMTKIILAYEKLNLTPGIHEVVISKGSANLTFDAIDVDSNGYLVAYAGIGMQLTAPEPGWKRIDDTDTRISLTDLSGSYTGKGRVDSAYYNSTYTQFTAGKCIFKFKGTKLRIVGLNSSIGAGAYSNDISIKIDGLPIEKYSNGGATKYQVLLYEKTGLDNIIHTVEISNNYSGAYVNIDALDIDGDMAGTGMQLTTPEPGWNRFDDKDSRITCVNMSRYDGDVAYYGSTSTYGGLNGLIKFKFYGSKLRIINELRASGMSSNTKIKIDEVTYQFSNVGTSTIRQVILYEVLNLPSQIHSVEIFNDVDNTQFGLDAIDTDGYLAHPILNQVSKIEDMKIGDCISARYKAGTSGAVGTFSEIGTSVVAEIPYASSATPDGMFYFIKVAKGLLIADRIIQHSIAWDTLNSGKFIEGGTEALIGTVKYRIRSLSGGAGGIDANKAYSSSIQNLGAYPENNEWDKYISNSNLENKITAGDDKIWHWNIGTASWVRETPVLNFLGNAVATGRITRGKYTYSGTNYGTDAKYISWQGSNNVGTLVGFRPALEFLETDAKAQNIYY